MKVRAIREGFYGKKRRTEGEVFDYLGTNPPKWVKPIEGRKVEVHDKVQANPKLPEDKNINPEKTEQDEKTNINPGKYDEIPYADIVKLAKERGIESKKRSDIVNELLSQDAQPEKTKQDEKLESMTCVEIATLAKKNFDCVINAAEPQDMVIAAYKNAEKTFSKKG